MVTLKTKLKGQIMSQSIGRGGVGAQIFSPMRNYLYPPAYWTNPALAYERWYKATAASSGIRIRINDRSGGSISLGFYSGPGTDYEGLTLVTTASGSNGYLDVTITGLTPNTTYIFGVSGIDESKMIMTIDSVTTRCYAPTLSVNAQTGVATLTNNESGSLLVYRINNGAWQDYTSPVQLPSNSYIYAMSQSVSGKLESTEVNASWFNS